MIKKRGKYWWVTDKDGRHIGLHRIKQAANEQSSNGEEQTQTEQEASIEPKHEEAK